MPICKGSIPSHRWRRAQCTKQSTCYSQSSRRKADQPRSQRSLVTGLCAEDLVIGSAVPNRNPRDCRATRSSTTEKASIQMPLKTRFCRSARAQEEHPLRPGQVQHGVVGVLRYCAASGTNSSFRGGSTVRDRGAGHSCGGAREIWMTCRSPNTLCFPTAPFHGSKPIFFIRCISETAGNLKVCTCPPAP